MVNFLILIKQGYNFIWITKIKNRVLRGIKLEGVDHMISLCMIVRNEEEYIRKCLDSVKDFVDEIIIVDTGSSDNTQNICKEFGAKIYDYVFMDDFSDARNYSLSLATGSWILVLDADESIDSRDGGKLKNLITEMEVQGKKGCAFTRYDYFNNGGWSEANIVRFFKNDRQIKYIGEVYEQVNIKNEETYYNKKNAIKIHHFGYLKDKQFIKKKRGKYHEITVNGSKFEPTRKHKMFYWLAQNYLVNGEMQEAINICNKGLEENNKSKRLFELKARILMFLGEYKKSREVLDEVFTLEARSNSKLKKGYSLFYDRAVNDLAQTYYFEGEYDRALESYSLMDFKETPYLLSNYALILYKLKRYEEALFYFNKALDINPYIGVIKYNHEDYLMYLSHTFFDFKGVAVYEELINKELSIFGK